MIAIDHTSALLHEFERDVRATSRKKKTFDQKRNPEINLSVFKLAALISVYLLSTAILRLKSYFLIKSTNLAIRRDYKIFLKSDTAGKDTIVSKWAKIKHDIQSNLKPIIELGNTTKLLTPTMSNLREFIAICVNFEKKINIEFQDSLNLTLSQDYLKEVSSKFEHLPKDVLDGLKSDRYSECL